MTGHASASASNTTRKPAELPRRARGRNTRRGAPNPAAVAAGRAAARRWLDGLRNCAVDANDLLHDGPNSGGNGIETESTEPDVTWFRVDDNLAFHAKTVAAGLAAMGLWLRAGSWSAGMLTDGFVPDHMVPALSDGTPELAERLVAAGFWRRVRNGYQFHEWMERNPAAGTVREHRRKEAERKAEWRARKAATRENEKERPGDVPPGHPTGQQRQSQRPSRRDNSVRPDGTTASVPALSRSTRPDPSLTTTEPPLRSGSGADAPLAPAPGVDLELAPTKITAQAVAAAWVDAVRANDIEPSKSQIGQVAKAAKELLHRNRGELVVAAAQAAGAKGYVQIDRELTAMNGRQIRRPETQRIPTTTARVQAIDALMLPEPGTSS